MLVPVSGLKITHAESGLQSAAHLTPGGIEITADGVTLDGNGALLIGTDRQGIGVRIEGRRNVTVRNLRLRDFYHGIHARNCANLRIENCQITSTAEVPANTIFLDIWLPAERAYGGAILLDGCENCHVIYNDLQHQMNGLLTYGCRRVSVRGNNASCNSGFGFHLFETSDSLFEGNYADYCCRHEPREPKMEVEMLIAEGGALAAGGEQSHPEPTSGTRAAPHFELPGSPPRVTAARAAGHVGADAAGFLIVHNSCRNVFRSNFARLGGDGFFLAGLSPDLRQVPCDDNLFEGNDGSLSPNIAFEATFSSGNIFRENRADRCNYGFWLGFSTRNVIENNRIFWNRQAGVAVENGAAMIVRANDFQRNGHGVLLWSKYAEKWFELFPENRTCHHWLIENNTFTRNDKAVCIAADKDHGIRPMPPEVCGRPEVRPHDNAIRGNDIQDNRVGVELFRADRTLIENNTINRNVECNVRREDDLDTTVRNNLGTGGAYL